MAVSMTERKSRMFYECDPSDDNVRRDDLRRRRESLWSGLKYVHVKIKGEAPHEPVNMKWWSE